MAELNTDGGGGKDKKVRSKKSNSKVDLTAMVDLAFLLITFFMLTTSLSKPQSMDLGMPEKPKPNEIEETIDVADNRSMTILIGENNKMLMYMGKFSAPLLPVKDYTFGKDGIRKIILERQAILKTEESDPKKQELIVIIKQNKKSTYKNMVDILDEMAITKVKIYAIVDIEKDENALLQPK